MLILKREVKEDNMNEETFTESYLKGRRDGITIGKSQQGGRNMICPLLSAGEYTRNVSAPTSSCDCLKEECAAWRNGQCDPTGLIESMTRIADALEEIREKMPSKEAFKKT